MIRFAQIFTSHWIAVAAAASALAPYGQGAVVINMPAPKKAIARQTSPIVASAPGAAPTAMIDDATDAGKLALQRYARARSTTANTYLVGGYYRNRSYGYSTYWGFPFFAFSSCGNNFSGSSHHHHGSHCH